jgi:hypothetical protein
LHAAFLRLNQQDIGEDDSETPSTDSESDDSALSDNSDSEDNTDGQYAEDEEDREEVLLDGLTLQSAMILILSFVTKHRLAGVVLEDLIDLLNIFSNRLKLSVCKLYNFIDSSKYVVEKHYYCSNCLFYITKPDDTNVCPVKGCEQNLSKQDNSLSYFVVLPLISQLQELCKRKDLSDLLFGEQRQYPSTDNVLRDFKDGQIYKKIL